MAKLLTLAFVSDAVYPYNKGGKETRLFEVTTRLSKLGYDVHIYCMKWWDGEDQRIENGVTLHGICPLIPLYDGPRRSIKQGILFGLSCFKLLNSKFDVVDVDHMPFFPLYSMRVVCWLKGKKMMATWHEVWGMEYWQEYLGGIKGYIAWWIERASVHFPDHIICISELTKNRLKSIFSVPEDKLTYIPCGIDISKVKKVPLALKSYDLLFIGRLLKHKNVDKLLVMFQHLLTKRPSLTMAIVGSGPELEMLKQLSRDLNVDKSVFFLDNIHDHTDVLSLIKSARILFLISSREGFGITVLEARACGTPVITSDHPDNSAQYLISSSEHGFVSSLAITSLVESAEKLLYKKKSNEINKELLRYDINIVVNELEQVYLSLLK